MLWGDVVSVKKTPVIERFHAQRVLKLRGYEMGKEYSCIDWLNRIKSRALKVIVVLCYRVAKELPLETDKKNV